MNDHRGAALLAATNHDQRDLQPAHIGTRPKCRRQLQLMRINNRVYAYGTRYRVAPRDKVRLVNLHRMEADSRRFDKLKLTKGAVLSMYSLRGIELSIRHMIPPPHRTRKVGKSRKRLRPNALHLINLACDRFLFERGIGPRK